MRRKDSIFACLVFLSALATAATAKVKIHDVGKLYPVVVKQIVHVRTLEDIKGALTKAHKLGLPVSIAGKKHSQGGQTLASHSLHLDMLGYNKILKLDKKNKIITVQSGATWADIQQYINPHNLAIAVMQSSNIFSVGGSLSVNAHGRDIHYGAMIDTIQSFRLMLANGKVLHVSRQHHPSLFKAVIGGYGLLGVVLDVDIQLVDNVKLKTKTQYLNYQRYPSLLKSILNRDDIKLHIARLSIAPGWGFLKRMYAVNYVSQGLYQHSPALINPRKQSRRVEKIFNLSRRSKLAKGLRWSMEKMVYHNLFHQKTLSRNNAMRPPIAFLFKQKPGYTDILQEYFIPFEGFTDFVDGMRHLFKAYKVNLLNVTVRYVKADKESLLSYARRPMIAIVLYLQIPLSQAGTSQAKTWTYALIQKALTLKGSFYLPYQLWPTRAQVEKAYPGMAAFIRLKKIKDPKGRFDSLFYRRYFI